MKFTNKYNIPFSLAVWLLNDEYDYNPNSISATSIIKPVKQIVLANRIFEDMDIPDVDISSYIASRMGTAIHDSIEKSWVDKSIAGALKKLGINKAVTDRIRINPDKEYLSLNQNCYPIYLEQRKTKKIDGVAITGKFDFIDNGKLEDFKSTSVWSYIFGSNTEKYKLQGSIYYWLNPEIITDLVMNINFIFTDWQNSSAKQNKDYPACRILTLPIELYSLEDTEEYLHNKIAQIRQYKDIPENGIPECTKEELWQQDSKWKYFKKLGSKRATKVFSSMDEAYSRYSEDRCIGEVIEFKGKVNACKYCNAFPVCQQKQQYLDNGTLEI